MRTPQPKTRFYQIKPGESGWARIWTTDDGCLSCLSDWGIHGYWWGNPGQEFRAFLVGRDADYITGCLSRNADPPKVRAFVKNVWPLFVEQLKVELQDEEEGDAPDAFNRHSEAK